MERGYTLLKKKYSIYDLPDPLKKELVYTLHKVLVLWWFQWFSGLQTILNKLCLLQKNT